jgi:hypothetical protein
LRYNFEFRNVSSYRTKEKAILLMLMADDRIVTNTIAKRRRGWGGRGPPVAFLLSLYECIYRPLKGKNKKVREGGGRGEAKKGRDVVCMQLQTYQAIE